MELQKVARETQPWPLNTRQIPAPQSWRAALVYPIRSSNLRPVSAGKVFYWPSDVCGQGFCEGHNVVGGSCFSHSRPLCGFFSEYAQDVDSLVLRQLPEI